MRKADAVGCQIDIDEIPDIAALRIQSSRMEREGNAGNSAGPLNRRELGRDMRERPLTGALDGLDQFTAAQVLIAEPRIARGIDRQPGPCVGTDEAARHVLVRPGAAVPPRDDDLARSCLGKCDAGIAGLVEGQADFPAANRDIVSSRLEREWRRHDRPPACPTR
jgi:hypothetical protein